MGMVRKLSRKHFFRNAKRYKCPLCRHTTILKNKDDYKVCLNCGWTPRENCV